MSRLSAVIRRLVKWYTSPSGLLLAGAIVSLAAFFVLSAFVDASWPAWIGLGSVILLAVFMPYRFGRQQGVALQAVASSREAVIGVLTETNRTVKALEKASLTVDNRIDRVEQGIIANELALDSIKIPANLTASLLRLEKAEASIAAEMTRHRAMAGTFRRDLAAAHDKIDDLGRTHLDYEERLRWARFREARSGSSTASTFQIFERLLTDDDLGRLQHWCDRLEVTDHSRASLGYLGHEIRFTEDLLIGRLASATAAACLRTLVVQAVDSEHPAILEIGTLFGISLAAMVRASRSRFDKISVTALDPLDGYYGGRRLDPLTGAAVSAASFHENMNRAGLNPDLVRLIPLLSTEAEALSAVGSGSVDVLLIDGDHSREGVEFDFEHYEHTVRPGGFIIFDDYGSPDWPDVATFVDQVVALRPDYEFIGAEWHTAVFRRV